MTTKPPHFDPNAFTDTMKESAQQIWLAGLGAFSKAQEEGGKAFETLVKNGIDLQRKTQETAEVKLKEASQKMTGIAFTPATRPASFNSTFNFVNDADNAGGAALYLTY